MYYKAVEMFLMCYGVGRKIISMEQNRDLNFRPQGIWKFCFPKFTSVIPQCSLL